MSILKNILRYCLIFIGAQFATTVVNVVTWNTLVVGVIYYNQPWLSIDLGYLYAPHWISENAVEVSTIDRDWSIKEPQQVLHGWTDQGLLVIWSSMFGSSILLSLFLARWLGKFENTLPNNKGGGQPATRPESK